MNGARPIRTYVAPRTLLAILTASAAIASSHVLANPAHGGMGGNPAGAPSVRVASASTSAGERRAQSAHTAASTRPTPHGAAPVNTPTSRPAATPAQASAHERTLRGTVVGEHDAPLGGVAVTVVEAHRSVVTKSDGLFAILLPHGGRWTVQAGQIGYTPARTVVTIPDEGDVPALRLVLVEAPIPVAEVSVRASSYGQEGQRQGAVLKRINIYTTPGAAADLMHTVHTLPGVHAPNEGAAIYVRGGEPSETLVRLDGGDVGHPYHYESASGGLFGIIDPSLVASAYFSSGGFSPRYANALSGVLDVETTQEIGVPSLNIGANIVGAGGSATIPLVEDKLGAIVSAHATSTDMLFRLYGSSREFVRVPTSSDAGAKLVAHMSETGAASVLWLSARDHTGVVITEPSFHGGYDGREHVELWNASWKDMAFGTLAVRANVARTHYTQDWSFSEFAYGTTENQWTARAEAVWPASPAYELTFGADGGRESADYAGRVPADSTDLGAGAPARELTQNGERLRLGAYVDHKLRITRGVYATIGGRADRYGSVRVRASDGTRSEGVTLWTADPRWALAWSLSKPVTIRLAGGTFHQAAPLKYTDASYGNPAIRPLEATHWIAGAEYKRADRTARVEAYRKTYAHLVLNDPTTHYANTGDGYAQGVDLFLEAKLVRFSGWLSYGYLISERHELEATSQVPSPYAPRHDLTLVGTYHMNGNWDAGAKAHWAAGSRYTPIVGATYDPLGDVYHPIDGPLYSAVYPDYARLDVRLTKLFELPAAFRLPSAQGVAYVEGMNILGIPNILRYTYSADYAQRAEERSYFSRRTFVFGVGLNW
jgi:hypothetical protein